MGGPDRRATGGWSRSRPGGGAAAGEFSQSSQPASQPARAGSPRLLRSCSAAPSARPTDRRAHGRVSQAERASGHTFHPRNNPRPADPSMDDTYSYRTWTWYGFARFRSGRCDRRSGAALRNHVGAGRQTHVRQLLLVAPIELNLPECSANDARPARDSCPPARPPVHSVGLERVAYTSSVLVVGGPCALPYRNLGSLMGSLKGPRGVRETITGRVSWIVPTTTSELAAPSTEPSTARAGPASPIIRSACSCLATVQDPSTSGTFVIERSLTRYLSYS